MADTVYTQIFTDNKLKEAERKQQVELNAQLREQKRQQEEIENMSVWERIGVTIADFFTEIGGGVVKLFEGVVDAGAMIAGGIGSIFGADTKWAEDFVARDLTQEWWYSWEDDFTKGSYINDAPIVKDIIRGVGQQLPTLAAIALAPVTGGASLSALPYTIGATITSAGGTGAEEALNDGADFGEALGYGVLQSGIEGAVEFATAGLGKGITSIGKSVGKGVGKSVAKSAGKIMMEEAGSEFIEEGLSALLNPLTKTVYKGSEALETYKDMTFYLDAAQQALVGGVVGGITGGAGAITQIRVAGGKSSYSIQQSVAELETLNTKETNLWKNNKLNPSTQSQIQTQRQAELENISNQLKTMSESERTQIIERYQLSDMLDTDGNIISQQITQDSENIANGEQTLSQEQNVSRKPLISDNIEAYSPSLRNTKLIFAPTQNVLSQSAQNAKKFVTSLNSGSKLVFTDNMPSNVNAFYDTQSKVLYFSNNATDIDVAAHEFTHSLEGTAEYETLKNYVLDNVDNLDAKIAEKIEQYKNVNTEAKAGENGQFVARYEAETEIVAEEMGKYLSDPKSVERIVNQSKGRAYRIWQWIKDAVAKLTKRGEKGEYYRFIRNVENLYSKAIQKSVGGIGLTDVRTAIDEFERQAKQELANEGENSYNNQKGGVRNGEVAEARYSINGEENNSNPTRRDLDNVRGQRQNQVSAIERFQEDSKRARLETKADRLEYLKLLQDGGYTKVSIDYIGTQNFVSYLEIKENALLPLLKDIRVENNNLGFKTKFVTSGFNVNGDTYNFDNALGLYSPTYDTIYIRIHESDDVILTNNHERMHNIERKYPNIFNDFKNEARQIFGDKYNQAVESVVKDWGNISFENKEREFISEFFAGGERVDFGNEINTKRNALVKKYKDLLANKAGLQNLRYSLKDTIEQDVLKAYGKTYSWKETGYLLQDGTKLDLSGRNNGAPGGYRSVDHREIFDIYDDSDAYGTDAMIEFIARGNIRVIPEYPGINLQIEPTEAQYQQIRSLIENLGWKEKAFMVDFDNANGETIDSLSYENAISANKIIDDIKYYFKEGKVPYKSQLSDFRYSLKDSKNNYLSKEQIEFFKDSKVRDDNGNLLVVYHGTDADFNVFDKSKNIEGNGAFWFSRSKDYADEMAIIKNGKRVDEFYLNLTNPLIVEMDTKEFADNVKEKSFIQQALNNKNDGVIFKENTNDGDVFYAVFNSNQIKLTTNKNPTTSDDIRFSLKDGERDYNYSQGQISKYVAEHSKAKAYSKTDAEQIVNTIVANQLSFGNKYGEISNKTKSQVIDTLWHALNTKNEGYRGTVALEIADYIIDNAIAQDIYAVETEDTFVVDALKGYLHSMDLSGIKGEIKHRYDNDNSPYLIWGKRKGTRGQSPDQIAMELAEYGIHIEAANEADIFFEIDEMYRDAIKNLKKATKERLADVADKNELKDLRQSIAREILNGYDTTGHKTKFAETIEKYTSKISALKNAVKEIKANNKAKNNVISTIERLRDEFVKSKPAGWKIPEQVVKFVKEISKVETWRNNISQNARQYLGQLQSNIDLIMDETQQNIYPYRETLRELASGEGELTTQELTTLDNVLRQFAWQLRNYDNVVFEGKSVSNTEIATQGVHESKQAQKILRSGDNLLVKFKNRVYANPFDRMAEFGLYRNNSIMVRLYNDMLNGDRKRANFVRDANNLFDEFLNKNKHYLKELQKEITLHNGSEEIKITKRQAITLYLTSLREQGRSHLFNISEDSGVVRLLDNKASTRGDVLEAFSKGRDINITRATIREIKSLLTATDNEYIDIVDNFFNKMSKDAKKETDTQLYGITNIEDGYYFPIKVSKDKIYTEAGQRNLDINQYILDMGMNKSVKPNASNKIVIDGVDNIISKHINDMSLYYGFAIPLTAYNRIMNKQILVGDVDTTSNVRSEIQKIDSDFEGYMNRLWQDIQGIQRGERGFISNVLSKIRWAGANAALGANPKVLFTQTLSLASAIAEFNPKYVVKGLGHFFGEKNKLDLAKYSSLMWERMQIGNSVDVTEIRQIGKEIGNKFGSAVAKVTKGLNAFTTKPISWMDSNVIQSLWFAAQYEIADTRGKGYEFGTEANKIEAGKRLDEAVFHTQQTSDPIGRSEWMRSQNEIVKFARMFTSDAIQLTGRLIASVNKYRIAKKMIRSGDTQLVEQGQQMLNSSKIGVAKAGSAFVLNQIMLLAIALAFKWIKGKDDDEEWGDIAKNEAIANLVGLIPFGGDIFDKLSGYEPTNMAYTALSNTVEIAEDLYNGISTLITGDYQDPVKRNAAIRKTALSLSRLFGIPLQNLESYLKGIVGKISPATREEYEALYKTKSIASYLDKMRKATENGDEQLADTIVNILFDDRTGKIKDDRMLDVISDLLGQGYDALPRTVNSTITFDGTEYTLTNRQHSKFMDVYSQSNDVVKNMISLSAFNRLDDAAKAKAINFVYDYYYNLGIEDMLGEDIETKTMLFAEAIPITQLAMAVAQASIYTADTDRDGKVISGTKKAKVQSFVQSLRLSAVQKYMIMGYLGYSNKYGETSVKAYINRLNISKEAKDYLFEASGYVA